MKSQIKYSRSNRFNWWMAFAFYLLPFTLLDGCKKFVEIPPPDTQLVSTSVFANGITATSAQLTIYAQLWSNESAPITQSMALYADELQNYSTSGTVLPYYTNNLQASAVPGLWANYYYYIFQANSVIAGLQNSTGVSTAVKNQLTGEALFTRAFLHFYLTNIYGDVPLVTSTNPNVNKSLGRTPRVQVLQQVVTDLKNAEGLLNSNYVDGTDTIATTQRVRPNKAVAAALLARAYLYLADYSGNAAYYTKADSAASAVIGNNTYSLSPLSGVFLENSSEAIWQLQTPLPASYDTPDAQTFVLTGAPSTNANNSATISTQLQSAFETGDQRLTNWVGSVTAGGTSYYFPYKYKVFNSYQNKEYTMVLRLGEQYLIRAEARAREGNLAEAAADLNMIRTRAGLPNTTAATQSDLLNAIQHERQVELFCEWGHRWFDLERAVATNLPTNAASVMSNTGQNICAHKGGFWDNSNYQLLFPIPLSDITTDINLTQNKGY